MLAQHTTEILNEFGILLDKRVHNITDNTQNVKLAMTKLMQNVKRRPCIVHTLQLVINTALESKEVSSLSKMLVKAKANIDHFRRNPSAMTRLTTIQMENGIKQHNLIHD